jgi:hypothetical protein
MLIWLIIWATVFATLAGLVTNAKNRGWAEGIALGALLGIIGLIITAFLPARSAGAAPPGWYPDPAGNGGQRYWNGSAWSDPPPPRPKKAQ